MLLLMPLHRRRGQLYIPLRNSERDRPRPRQLPWQARTKHAFPQPSRPSPVSAAIIWQGPGLRRISPAVFPAFLPATLAEPVLMKAQKAGASLFEQSLQQPQWRRQLQHDAGH